ncbi:EG45-like domain containing protein [Humulus lupulus]|uniref:EG45-like domain containing protein n=1 Tax=Humulus lupulus TaxID=3486 RepID=UPI002B40AED9|nr:EG45-like domain containing protein [Humulus lupulus]
MEMRVLVVCVGMLICQFLVAFAHKGTATFYTPPYTLSACNGKKEEGVLIAAASEAMWDDKAACGRRYRVRCIGATNHDGNPCRGGSVVVKIVDFCPSGCQGTIDLSQEAFAMIADPDAGKIKIKFTQ